MGFEYLVGKVVLGVCCIEFGFGFEGIIEGSVGDFIVVVGKGISVFVELVVGGERKWY